LFKIHTLTRTVVERRVGISLKFCEAWVHVFFLFFLLMLGGEKRYILRETYYCLLAAIGTATLTKN